MVRIVVRSAEIWIFDFARVKECLILSRAAWNRCKHLRRMVSADCIAWTASGRIAAIIFWNDGLSTSRNEIRSWSIQSMREDWKTFASKGAFGVKISYKPSIVPACFGSPRSFSLMLCLCLRCSVGWVIDELLYVFPQCLHCHWFPSFRCPWFQHQDIRRGPRSRLELWEFWDSNSPVSLISILSGSSLVGIKFLGVVVSDREDGDDDEGPDFLDIKPDLLIWLECFLSAPMLTSIISLPSKETTMVEVIDRGVVLSIFKLRSNRDAFKNMPHLFLLFTILIPLFWSLIYSSPLWFFCSQICAFRLHAQSGLGSPR